MTNNGGLDIQQLANPLSEQQKQDLRDVVANAPAIESSLDMAESAGIDVSTQRREFEEKLEQARKLLNVYDK